MNRRELFAYFAGLISYCWLGLAKPKTRNRIFDGGFHHCGLIPNSRDNIPAMLSRGEYWVSKRTYDKLGPDLLNAINK